jgi:hypothetical protein
MKNHEEGVLQQRVFHQKKETFSNKKYDLTFLLVSKICRRHDDLQQRYQNNLFLSQLFLKCKMHHYKQCSLHSI